MANLNRGEISVAAPSGRVTLAIDFNALCGLEEQGHDLPTLAAQAQAGKLLPMRRILHAAMLKHRPEATERDAGDLASEVGIKEISAEITRLFRAAGLVGAEEDGGGEGEGEALGNARRRKRRDG
ncbi:MAG: NH3-dependent NAD+ synthetase [Paracoccaceae bacterium]|jgi:NH3-dependent NAD+ synthetase